MSALASSVLVAGTLACGGDHEPLPSESEDEIPEVRQFTFSEAPPEDGQASLLSTRPDPGITDVLNRLDAARRDSDCHGVLLRVGPMSGAWGRVPELQDAIASVRAAGKPVHCHFDLTDNLGYALLASSCDRISMTPAGSLDLVGVAAHVFYARTLLANLGVRADIMQIGRFKGAADPFTMDAMPETTRQTLGALLDDLQAFVVESIAEGRDLPPDRVRELIDEGPFDASVARRAGLVDDVGFVDEAAEHARRAAGARRVRAIDLQGERGSPGLGDLLAALAGESPESPPEGPRVALVHLEGQIVDEEESGTRGARSGPFVRAMRSFADDDEVKALVLRVDSPGGSALASDRMWHALREVVARKPVIVSVGDMAASGGYYVASAGTEIYAHDTSIVGSIGVVGGKITVNDLAERIGVHIEVLSRGRHAAYATPARPFTDEERRILRRSMRRTYARFVRRVMTGRHMQRDAVERVAEGRILSGRDARAAGLVDREGGLRAALARARELGELPDDSPVEQWPRPRGLLDTIAQSIGHAGRDDRAQVWLTTMADAAGPVGQAVVLAPMLFGRERTAVALPFVMRLE